MVSRSWFPERGFQSVVSREALGNKSFSFCEAVNCERSEQEGKFLFAMLITIRWFQMTIRADGFTGVVSHFFYLMKYIMDSKIDGCKKGFTYYSKCKIESKIDFLIDNFDEDEISWKDLEKIMDIFDEIEKVVSRLDRSMYRKMIIDFLFNKIFHLLNLDAEFPIFRSKDTIRKYEECWDEIQ